MFRSWQRNLLTWLMAAVFAVPAFMGQGLHAVFGLRHGPFCDGHAACVHAEHALLPLERGHESSPFAARLGAVLAAEGCHGCPVCDYLALSVDAGPAAPRLETEAAVWAMPDARVCQPCPASFGAFSARGPPQG